MRFKKLGLVLLIVIMTLTIIPTTIFVTAQSEELSEDFKSILTGGKFVLNYAKPDTKMGAQLAFEDFEESEFNHNFYETKNKSFSIDYDSVTEDLSKVDISLWTALGIEEQHTVDIVWKCDEQVLAAAQSIIDKFTNNGANQINVQLSNLEYINYLTHSQALGFKAEEMANYSSDVKKLTENKNFTLNINSRSGNGSDFHTEANGDVRLFHNGTVYYIKYKGIIARAYNVLYVPENTSDTKEALATAAQKRINDYIGEDIINITATNEMLADYKSAYPDNFEEGGVLYFLNDAAGGYVFDLKVNGNEDKHKFVIIKDDNKLAVPTCESIDVNTDASVATDSPTVPLDTVIKVEKITHGEEHERICGTLEIKDGEIFDIRLHSGSLDDYITELKNGKFKVRLPIKNEYKGKELVVYYVDANNNKTKYNVTVKNNFAFFETDHFSIYTLTTVSEDVQTPPSTPDDIITSPNTDDNSNITLWFVMLFVSLVGLIGTYYVRNKKAIM